MDPRTLVYLPNGHRVAYATLQEGDVYYRTGRSRCPLVVSSARSYQTDLEARDQKFGLMAGVRMAEKGGVL